jgi:hypothetical protein
MDWSISVYDSLGARQFEQTFVTMDCAIEFLEDHIARFLQENARYVVIRDETNGTEKKYRADRISHCILSATDWSAALCPANAAVAINARAGSHLR